MQILGKISNNKSIMPKEYIDAIEGLPEVTQEQNECVLKVVNGRWAVAPIKTLVRAVITTPPTKTSYFAGEMFDPTGMVITAYFDDESSRVTEQYTYPQSGFKITDTKITITVTIQGVSVTVEQLVTVSMDGTVTLTPVSGVTYTEGLPSDYAKVALIGMATAVCSAADEDTEAIYFTSNANGNYHVKVGDSMPVYLKGTLGTVALDDTVYAFVLGFNHNKANNQGLGVYFQLLKKTASGDYSIFIDSHYTSRASASSVGWFNYGFDNTQQWASSNIRRNVLYSSDSNGDATPATKTSPKANSLMAILPAGLRSIISPMRVAVSYNSSTVNYYIDYLPLPAPKEICNLDSSVAWSYGGGAEPSYSGRVEKQFRLYKGQYGAQRTTFPTTQSAAYHWTRSGTGIRLTWGKLYDTSMTEFGTGEGGNSYSTSICSGISPIFLVGLDA